jgi:hypothetical protein
MKIMPEILFLNSTIYWGSVRRVPMAVICLSFRNQMGISAAFPAALVLAVQSGIGLWIQLVDATH